MPFIADDWANLSMVERGVPALTAFGYFRPLYLGSFWAEFRLWGLRPSLFHATNLALIVGCAVLLAICTERLTGSARWATWAGVLFALHPYHVENAAWIAARADCAATLLALTSWLLYDRWTARGRGVPVGAVMSLEAALLFKEAVALLPLILIVARLARGSVRPSRREWSRGLLPMCGVSAFHFLVLRALVVGDGGSRPLATFGLSWAKRGVDFLSAAILPFHTEIIESQPAVFALVALAFLAGLVLLSRRHVARSLRIDAAFGAAFVLSLVPTLLSFQARYLFFPSAVAAIALAGLVVTLPATIGGLVRVVVVGTWLVLLSLHWSGWLQAGRVSGQVVSYLTAASKSPEVAEIVIANLPYRVAGAPIAGDLGAAVALSGGRRVSVRAATALDLPDAAASGLDGESSRAVRIGESSATVAIRVPPRLFSRIFLPLSQPAGTPVETDAGTLRFDGAGGAVVEVPRNADDSRAALVWSDGGLRPLFAPRAR